MFIPNSSLPGDLLVPRTLYARLMVEIQPLSSGCPRLRAEMWRLCPDLREKKEAGWGEENVNRSITCQHSWGSCYVPGPVLNTLPFSHL